MGLPLARVLRRLPRKNLADVWAKKKIKKRAGKKGTHAASQEITSCGVHEASQNLRCNNDHS